MYYIDDTAPFKFDSPSPDDLVSNGLRSSKMGSKGMDTFIKINYI